MAEEKELQLDDESAEGEGGGKSKKKLIIIIVAVVLLLAIGGGAAFFLLGSDDKEENTAELQADGSKAEKPKEDEEPKKPVYVPLDPAFIVSFQTGKRARFLQLRVELLTYKESIAQDIKQNMPMIRNEIVMIVGSQDFAELRTAEGRKKLQQTLVDTLNQALTDDVGSEDKAIETVLFTDYVMQ